MVQLPAAVLADGCEQVLPGPGGGAHAINPLRHGGFRLHWPGAAPRLCRGITEHQVPPAAAVLGHQQHSAGKPLRLEHRDPCPTGNGLRSSEGSGGIEGGAEELAAVPGHGRLLPFHPRQLPTIGTQTGIAGEVSGLMQQHRLLIGRLKRHLHELVATVDLADTDPSVAPQVDHAIGKLPFSRLRQPSRRRVRGWGFVVGSGQTPVLAPQATVLAVDPDQQHTVVLFCRREDPAAVVVHPAAQVDGLRCHFRRGCLHIPEAADQGGGASLFMGSLLEPQQPDRPTRAAQSPWCGLQQTRRSPTRERRW